MLTKLILRIKNILINNLNYIYFSIFYKCFNYFIRFNIIMFYFLDILLFKC